jgi:pimeloyl-ACP methyl ester carboxylesterase
MEPTDGSTSRTAPAERIDPGAAPGAEHLRLESGRRVAIYTLATGSPQSRTIVFCHPAPGSGAFDPDPAQTLRRDVTLLAIDRAGYGRSEPMADGAWAGVDAAADDLASVIDARDGRPVGVAGWAAGGLVSLALAARRPDLVDRVVVIATPAPNDEVPWIPEERVEAMSAMQGMRPESVRAILAKGFRAMVPADPRSPEALALLGAGAADETALALPGARARLGDMLAAAFEQGAGGLASDVAGFSMRSWGFEPGEVVAKTLLLYGTQDPIAGPPHATWWRNHLSNARVEMVPGAGHLVVVPMWKRVLAHLAPRTLRKGGAVV